MSDYSNYPLDGLHVEYFRGPLSHEHEFRTVPALLRKVADWMEERDIADPEFRYLLVRVEFVDEDDFIESVTLFYKDLEQGE